MRRSRLDWVGHLRRSGVLAGTDADRPARATRPVRWSVLTSAGTLALLSLTHAPSAFGQRALAIVPNAAITQTLTDNYLLDGRHPAGDSITRLSAGASLLSQAGLLRGYLNYTLSSVLYARHSDRNEFQNALNANMSADLVEGRVQLLAEAAVSQSAISAFGTQPNNNGLSNSNTTELRTLRITPTFRGPLGPGLRYTGSVAYSLTDASKTDNGDSSASAATLHLEPSTTGRLGWAVDAAHVKSAYKLGRATKNDRATGTGNWRLDRLDLLLRARAGIELTDLVAGQRERYTTWGVGAVWAPSPRTRLDADLDHRFFGQSHSLGFEYRTPLTVWRITESRSLSTGEGSSGVGGRGAVFDLYFAQFASVEPDPVKRAELVNSFLRSSGIDPLAGAAPGFLRSAATVDDRLALSVAYRAQRSAAVLLVSHSRTRRLDSASTIGVQDDLANATEVTQDSVSIDLSHRLSPQASLGVVLSAQQGHGTLASQQTRQRQLSLLHSTQLTVQSNLVLGARRGLYQTSLLGYAESAVFATYGIRF